MGKDFTGGRGGAQGGRGGRGGDRGGRGGRGAPRGGRGMKGGAKTLVVPHRLPGVFLAKG